MLPYVSTFNPNNTEMFGIFKNNMHILTNDQTMREALSTSKIIKSKRQPPNLKRLITKAKGPRTVLINEGLHIKMTREKFQRK